MSSKFGERFSLKEQVEDNRERRLEPPLIAPQICAHKTQLHSHVHICTHKLLEIVFSKENFIPGATNSLKNVCLSIVDVWDWIIVYWQWCPVFCRMFDSSLTSDCDILTFRCGIQRSSWIDSAKGEEAKASENEGRSCCPCSFNT